MINREKLVDQLSEWIDSRVIANAIVDVMSEAVSSGEMTLDNAKAIYIDFLQNELRDSLRGSLQYGRWRS